MRKVRCTHANRALAPSTSVSQMRTHLAPSACRRPCPRAGPLVDRCRACSHPDDHRSCNRPAFACCSGLGSCCATSPSDALGRESMICRAPYGDVFMASTLAVYDQRILKGSCAVAQLIIEQNAWENAAMRAGWKWIRVDLYVKASRGPSLNELGKHIYGL